MKSKINTLLEQFDESAVNVKEQMLAVMENNCEEKGNYFVPNNSNGILSKKI